MILDINHIIKDVALETEINEDLLQSIQRIIFKDISDWTKDPTSIKLYVSKLGCWYFKKAKTIDKLDLFTRLSNNSYHNYDYNQERIAKKIKNYNFIVEEYKKYTADKLEKKYEKYGKEAYESHCLGITKKKI